MLKARAEGWVGKNFGKAFDEDGLVYQVKDDKGLRPKICVYAVDDKRSVVHVTKAVIGVSLTTGVEVFGLEVIGGYCGWSLSESSGFHITGNSQKKVYPFDRNPETLAKFLADIHEQKGEEGFDVARVINPGNISSAVERHASNYAKQFGDLVDKMREEFTRFIEDKPGLFQY